MFLLSALLFSIFCTFMIVTSNNVSLRNMTSNLRGTPNNNDSKIDDYLNASAFINSEPVASMYVVDDFEPVFTDDNQMSSEFDITDFAGLSDYVYPSGFDIQEYLLERKRNIIGKHLHLKHFIANVDIIG